MNKPLILILTLLVCACQSGQQKAEDGTISLDSLKSEVLFIHDEVMPKMGELRRVRKDLMLQADSLIAADSVAAKRIDSLANNLANASEGMMQWMRAYEPDFEGTEEEKRAYFEAQKVSIQKVKEEMERSLSEGSQAIGKE